MIATSTPAYKTKFDQLDTLIYSTTENMAQDAAAAAAAQLSAALEARGKATAIFATGNSQLQFLDALVKGQGTRWTLDWSRITLFHMDEYLGLPDTHRASFRKYMKDRVEALLKPAAFHYLEGDAMEPIAECERYTELLQRQPIDLCCLGIGENGHIAFNDPAVADFNDPRWVKIVKLDDACRQQQVGEGYFDRLNEVPAYALTLTIPALCSAGKMLAIVPEERKSAAVYASLMGPVSTSCPGSFLRQQAHCTLFLDTRSASRLQLKP